MLKGEVTALRAIAKTDLPQLLIWRNNPEYRKFFREYRELNEESQEKWFESKVMNDNCTRMFAIVELDTSKLIGACGLCYIDWINRNADFSIYIGKDNLYIDDKYAIDAAKTMMKYGFGELNLHRLWSEIYSIDVKKQKMFRTLGFALEGCHKETHWTEDKWVDSLYYGITEQGYRSLWK